MSEKKAFKIHDDPNANGASGPGKRRFHASPVDKMKAESRVWNIRIGEKVRTRDLAVFSRQFALLLNLGVTALRALNIIADRTENARMAKIIRQIGQKVENGASLSEAMSSDKNIFGAYFITAVQAGEESGNIASTMEQMADYMEKEDFLRSKIRKALAFPVVTLLVALAVVIFLLIEVIPTFAKVYSDAGVKLPAVTQFLISASHFVQQFWWVILLAVAALFLIFYRSGKLLRIKTLMDRLYLILPIIKDLTMKIAVYRFARITATMLESGVSILATLRLAAAATGNSLISQSIINACSDIDMGKTVEESFQSQAVFPPLVIDMIGVGEEVGSVGAVLRKIAQFYERDVDDFVSNLTTVLEPLLTLMMGLVVAFIALGMFLPYFNINLVIH